MQCLGFLFWVHLVLFAPPPPGRATSVPIILASYPTREACLIELAKLDPGEVRVFTLDGRSR